MFPIGNDRPWPIFPFFVFTLIAANIFVFTFELRLTTAEIDSFIKSFGLVPAEDWVSPFESRNFGEWAKPYFTSMFLHGGFLHILTNMWVLWIFGGNVEGAMGRLRFVFFYVLCGLGAGITHAFLYPDSTVPVVGASGAIAGVMGSYLLLFPGSRLKMFMLFVFYPVFFELPALVFLVIWFVGQLLSGSADYAARASLGQDAAGIAFFAHVGGFIAGMILTPFFRRSSSSGRAKKRT